MKKSAYWLLLLFLLVGCNSQKTTKNLNLIDSLLSVRSDSALSLLKGMEVKDFSEEDFAYYALLMTQAMHKNYVTFTSDSLIHASVTYYLKMDDSERKAKAMFYQGVVYEELGDKEQALRFYKQAEVLMPYIRDGHLTALIYEYLGTINAQHGISDKADSYYRKALTQAFSIKQYNLVVANLGHLGMEHLRFNRIDSAMSYYEKELEYLPQLCDNDKVGVYHNLGTFYLNHVKPKKSSAVSYLQKFR